MSGYCKECGNQQCVCDVLKTANILSNTVIIQGQPCDHIYAGEGEFCLSSAERCTYDDKHEFGYIRFTYCPKCGKKL